MAAASGAHGVGVHGALESAGAKATPISMARDADGYMFALGIMTTGSFAAFGGAGDRGR